MQLRALFVVLSAALALPLVAAGVSKRAAQTATAAYSSPSKPYTGDSEPPAPLHRRAETSTPSSVCSELAPLANTDKKVTITPVCCARLVEPDGKDANTALAALGFGVQGLQGAFAEVARWALTPGAEAVAEGGLVGLTCSELGTSGDVDDWYVNDLHELISTLNE